jgi:TorA maturation chaperone TorD
MTARGQQLNAEARHWLRKAAAWRYFSLLFRLPSRETRNELKRLGREVPRGIRGLGQEWTSLPLKAAEAEYHRVLGAGGVPCVESSYDDNALAGRGPLLADVRAFYEAFAYTPEKLPAELPDHIAVELDFLSYLAMKASFAHHAGTPEQKRVSVDAYHQFAKSHLNPWVGKLQASVARAGTALHSKALVSLNAYLSAPVQV